MNITLYIVELSLILLLFHTVFAIIHKKSNQFTAQRWFILAAIISAILIPFLPGLFQNPAFGFEVLLPQVTIGGVEEKIVVPENSSQGFSSSMILYAIYMTVVVLMLFNILRSTLKISSFIKNGEKKPYGDQTIVFSEYITSPCSFFNYVFIPKTITDTEELETCIQHELTHSHLRHSIDKIILQLAKAILWWHPSIWYFSRQMELVHEYQVDQRMLNETSKETYQKVLIKFLLYPTGLRIANPFSSNIKKRIIMMNKFELKNSPFRTAAALVLLFIGVAFIHACSEDQNIVDGSKTEIKAEKSENTPESYEVEVKDTIITLDFDTHEETVKIVNSKKEIFNVVDQMPIFPGCDEALEGKALAECSYQKLMEFIFSNIKYPKAAQEKDVEGLVLVKFVVNTDGTIGHREFVRTLGHGMEETVDQMLAKMNKEIRWKPGVHDGKDVNVAFTLPVKFKLED